MSVADMSSELPGLGLLGWLWGQVGHRLDYKQQASTNHGCIINRRWQLQTDKLRSKRNIMAGGVFLKLRDRSLNTPASLPTALMLPNTIGR